MAKRRRQTKRAPARDRSWLAWVLGSADSFEGYFAQSRSLALSFVLIAPLLLAYEFALAYYPPARSTGAGRLFKQVFHAIFQTRAGLALNIVVVLCLLLAIFVLARRGRLRLGLILPMVLESAGWTVVLVGIAVVICRRLHDVELNVDSGSAIARSIIASVGAGVYEEILFRLVLTSLLFLAGLRLFERRIDHAAVFAAILSAVIFALSHVCAWSDPFSDPNIWVYLLFYFTSGVFFSLLYTFRGLGVAVYTHVLYDIVVYFSNA